MLLSKVRAQAKRMRLQGKTYANINKVLRVSVPKSTLSYWFRNLAIPHASLEKIRNRNEKNLEKGRKIALLQKQRVRILREKKFRIANRTTRSLLRKSLQVRKISLSMLYLAEGSKTERASLMFGNSNPPTVLLFLSLLRSCYDISNEKLRLTVQCRADQNVLELQKFWSNITGVPLENFYKAQIDRRSLGRPTKKKNYKGVCRVDYFSSDIDFELKYLAKHIEKTKIS